MSEVPIVAKAQKNGEKEHENDELRPYIQIFKGSKAVFNELSKYKKLSSR